jgi:O-antigen/teichoic acid export membrane protein
MLSAWVQKMRSSTVARNAGWMFVGQGISIVNQGIYFVFVARLLGVSEYGLLVGAGAVVAMVSQYSSLGCGFVFLRYVGSGRGRLSEYWGSILAVTVSAGLLLSAGLHVAGRFLLPATPAGLLLSLALGDCVCSQLTLCCGQIFQTFERMRYTAMLNMATNGARAVLAACWLFGVGHATATLWAYTSLGISLATSAVAVGMVMAQFGRPMLNRRLLLSRLGEGFIFSVSGSTTSAYNDLDKAMLGHYGMNIANGIYTMAYRVVDIAYLPVRSIHAAAFPRFFRYGADGVAASARYGKIVLRRTIVFGVLAAVGMAVLAPIVPLCIGRGFAPSVSAIRWLALIPLFRCFHLSAGDAMAGAGYQRYRLAAQAVAAGGNFALNLYLIPRFSWQGAAFASLLTDGGLGALSWAVLLMLRRREQARGGLVTAIEVGSYLSS